MTYTELASQSQQQRIQVIPKLCNQIDQSFHSDWTPHWLNELTEDLAIQPEPLFPYLEKLK